MISRSNTTTQHSRYDSSGRVISSPQRPLPDNTQLSRQTYTPAGKIQTQVLSRRAAVDLRHRPCGHWDRHHQIITTANITNIRGGQPDDLREPTTQLRQPPSNHHIKYFWFFLSFFLSFLSLSLSLLFVCLFVSYFSSSSHNISVSVTDDNPLLHAVCVTRCGHPCKI